MNQDEQALLEFFAGFISSPRKALIEEALNFRTRHLTVVLEDIYQPQNASAAVRTCDCFGIQDLHIIENKNEYRVNPKVVHGASKWVSLYRYQDETDNTRSCLRKLRDDGYSIIGTTPSQNATSIHELDISDRIALVFGTEATGLSEIAVGECDMLITYPMYGFTESLNISVSVSLCLGALVPRIHRSGIQWKLSESEKSQLRLQWYRQSVNRSDVLEREFLKKLQ